MALSLNGFSSSRPDVLALFALDRQKNIREMIAENERTQEFLAKNFAGFSRITVDTYPGKSRPSSHQ